MLTPRQQLDNLANFLVEDILAMTDEEILAEVKEDGGDPEQIATEMRALFESVVRHVNEMMRLEG